MPDWLLGTLALAVIVGGVLWWYLRYLQHRAAVSRIPELVDDGSARELRAAGIERPYETLLPWILGLLALAAALLFVPLGVFFALSVGFLFWVVGSLIRSSTVSRRVLRLEQQLAEALDHMVTSLHAGIGIIDALGGAEKDARKPLKPYLAQFLLRLRLGDDPPAVCREMAEIIPLESFRLFYYALGVQWEGGGNLAPTLATTGRFIRDRVELGRRVRAQSTEARFSVIMILGLTYFLAWLMWNMDRGRVEGFLSIPAGQKAAAVGVFMQALGAAWISRMSRIRY